MKLYCKLHSHDYYLTRGCVLRGYADRVACVDPDVCESVCQSRVSCTNIAYPTLVLELLPDGQCVRGVYHIVF